MQKRESSSFIIQRLQKAVVRFDETYPNATLYGDRAALKALQSNSIQLAAPSFAKFTDHSPQLQLFDLPFLFRDTAHLHQVLDGEVGSSLLQAASSKQQRAARARLLGQWLQANFG